MTLKENPDYQKLLTKLDEITQLKRISAVIGYDEMVFMPKDSAASAERGKQKAILARLSHEKSIDPEVGELVNKLLEQTEENAEANVNERRILEITKKDYDKTTRVPIELASKAALLSSKANSLWVKSRQADDYTVFADTLQECFDVAMEKASAVRGANEDVSLYSQMLDEFEPGMAAERIDDIFNEVQAALVPLIKMVSESKNPPCTDALTGNFPLDVQKELGNKIVSKIGFDDKAGRIDVAVHPFTSSMSSKDVRITSRYSETEWFQGLQGLIHEGGHAIYEQNLPLSSYEIDTFLSMGTHESQSLFWERHIGKGLPFWKWAAPLLNESFENFNYTPEEIYNAVNNVKPSLIRVEADELTYPLHVILRYKIEKDIVSGNLKVEDIPKRWNLEMKEMLNVNVPSDKDGCLQDIHWSLMAYGYFPTYLIGGITAAQLYHYCEMDIPDIESKIEKGQFDEIKAWLTDKVHRHGKRYKSLDDMLEAQLGEKLNPKYFIQYLAEKYTALYK